MTTDLPWIGALIATMRAWRQSFGFRLLMTAALGAVVIVVIAKVLAAQSWLGEDIIALFGATYITVLFVIVITVVQYGNQARWSPWKTAGALLLVFGLVIFYTAVGVIAVIL